MKQLKKWLPNLPFKYKLLLGIVGITSAILLMISFVSYRYQMDRNTEEALLQSEHAVSVSKSVLSAQFHSMLMASTQMLIGEPFNKIISDLAGGKRINFSQNFSSVNENLAKLIQNHRLLSGAFLYASDGSFFSISIAGLKKDRDSMFPEDIWSLNKITALARRHNDILQIGYTVPVVMPVTKESELYLYSDKDASRLIRFVLLLDADKLNEMSSFFSSGFTDIQYLTNQQGIPLDVDEKMSASAYLKPVQAFAASVNDKEQRALVIGRDTYYVTVSNLDIFGIKTVHIVRRSRLLADMATLRTFHFAAWILGSILAVMLCVGLANFLIRPLKSVTKVVEQINNRTYVKKKEFKYRDEIGILGKQINSMYDTIQNQIVRITEDERLKAQTEIQMLSEQVNPHFLYNTLECIHLKIMGGHTQTASIMLEGLGKYLRITLNVGRTLIPLRQEVEHVTEYMALMKRYSPEGTHFTCRMEEDLKDVEVPKIMLQPLVENSIRHGFDQEYMLSGACAPAISIQIMREKDDMLLSVEDNGRGFDPIKISALVNELPARNQEHFGLSNLNYRLRQFYGTGAGLSFVSIPYYRNVVTIRIPLT